MARDYLEILRQVEGFYPQSVGGNDRDDTLRSNLVIYASDTMQAVNRRHRWSYDYQEISLATVVGTQTYDVSGLANITHHPLGIKSAYWMDANNKPTFLDKYDRDELLRVYNLQVAGPPTQNRGAPVRFAITPIIGTSLPSIELFPCPDNNGPAGGSYVITFEAYMALPRIIETTGTITTGTTSLTVPSSIYVSLDGQQDATLGVSVRGAGPLQTAAINSDLFAIPSEAGANTYSLDQPARATVTAAQTFFNSRNWLILYYPKVLLYGMLREVATYVGDDGAFQKWDQRFEIELESAHAHDVEMSMLQDIHAVAQPGQRTSALRMLDQPADIEVRGGP